MNNRIKFLMFIGTVLCTAFFSEAAPQKIDVKVALDSAYIIMGRQTPLHVEVVGELNENGGIIVPDTLWRDVEVASISDPVVTDLGNGRKLLRQELILQAFDSGLYTLPPVLYVQDETVAQSNRPALKVIPVDVDSMATVHDYADVITPPRHVFDFLPDWMTDYGLWILIALIVIAAGLYIYLAYIRKGKLPLVHTPKPVPPYELAIKQLDELHAAKLCERGEEKEFYTRLTDILRNYLDSRFGINAMEMTSSQILRSLNSNEETRVPKKYMSAILETADFVKFAKVRPLPDDNTAAFRSALQFVEDTKPTPEPESQSADESEPASPKKSNN
ncbi:MAG: cell wall anchor protein [Paramuribaculum sp.]|nr:cell wall anchor protein [Paramuribaculum sp.]